MAKLKLDINDLEDDYFTGSRLLGIMSQIKNYRFCWLVNSELNYDFRLLADSEIHLKKKERNYFFPVYRYCETYCEMEHYIYFNQHEGEFLLPDCRHFDFLWMVKAEQVADDEFLKLQQQIKSIATVQLVTDITEIKIKNKSNLIL